MATSLVVAIRVRENSASLAISLSLFPPLFSSVNCIPSRSKSTLTHSPSPCRQAGRQKDQESQSSLSCLVRKMPATLMRKEKNLEERMGGKQTYFSSPFLPFPISFLLLPQQKRNVLALRYDKYKKQMFKMKIIF